MIQQIDNSPIGVFDSGLGGLTAVSCLTSLLPEERIIYFGDTARTPYGSKAVSTIQKFSLEIADFLLKNNAKMIVIACNTVSATCLDLLREHFPQIPIIGIIEPAVRKVAQEWAGKRIGIIGTKVTIHSGQYESKIKELAPSSRVFSIACPLFVPAIEEGMENTELMEHIVRHYMDEFVCNNALDVLVLGCTHYPMVETIIRRLYPQIQIVNPSEIVAQEVQNVLKRYNICAQKKTGENLFYASDLAESFIKMAKNITSNKNVVVELMNFESE